MALTDGTRPLRYLSVCSGIEAASVAWQPLGWEPVGVAEIDPFCCAVLAERYPEVRNYGDFTGIARKGDGPAFDLLVGGTPCQSFSVAGLRTGLDDDRGNLALEFFRLVARTRPQWVVWENVPGVLSAHGGRDFGAIVGALAKLGYGWAYRVMDAQYLGVPQRRRRVFVVGYLGDWRPPVAVLVERHSLSGDTPPRRAAGQGPPARAEAGAPGDDRAPLITGPTGYSSSGDGSWPDGLGTLTRRTEKGPEDGMVVHPILEAGARTGASTDDPRCGMGVGADDDPMFTLQSGKQHAVTVALRASQGGGDTPHVLAFDWQAGHGNDASFRGKSRMYPVRAGDYTGAVSAVKRDAVAVFDPRNVTSAANQTRVAYGAPANTLHALGLAVIQPLAIRRLTPVECERLQGLQDGYTAITYRGRPAADGPRYRVIGNSMAVPVMAWIGRRVQMVADRMRALEQDHAP